MYNDNGSIISTITRSFKSRQITYRFFYLYFQMYFVLKMIIIQLLLLWVIDLDAFAFISHKVWVEFFQNHTQNFSVYSVFIWFVQSKLFTIFKCSRPNKNYMKFELNFFLLLQKLLHSCQMNGVNSILYMSIYKTKGNNIALRNEQ